MELVNTVSEKEYKTKLESNDLMFKATEVNGVVNEIEFKLFKGDYTDQFIVLAGKVYNNSTKIDLSCSDWFSGVEKTIRDIQDKSLEIFNN